MACCLLEQAEREWGAPPSRAIRTPRIFPRIFCAFLRDSGTPIFQAPKLRRKMCAKMGAKICAPKICAKNWFEHSVCLEDGSQKKNTKKICAKLAQNPSPNNFFVLLGSNSGCGIYKFSTFFAYFQALWGSLYHPREIPIPIF